LPTVVSKILTTASLFPLVHLHYRNKSASNLQLHCEFRMICTVNTVAKNCRVNSENSSQVNEIFRVTGSNQGLRQQPEETW